MNRVIIDTSGYSAFMRGHSKAKTHIQSADEIYLNPVILGELLFGFRMGKYKQKNEMELNEFLSSTRVNVLSIDHETAKRYALILERLKQQGTLIPTNDLWIAASAMQHGATLVTLDRHFLKVKEILIEFLIVEA